MSRSDQTTDMTTAPTLPDGIYFFRDEAYPLRELAMSEAPADLASFLVAQAKATGVELIRNEIVELVCKGQDIPDQRFTVYWPSSAGLHVLVPKKYVVGRA